MKNLFEMQKKLVSFVGPSGFEFERARFIAAEVAPYVDEVFSDALGNVFAHKKGDGPRIMVEAHMDTVGFVAEFIDELGYVKVFTVGGAHSESLAGKRIRFKNGAIGVFAVEGKKFIQKKSAAETEIGDYYVDLGVAGREEAEKLVKPGDPAVYTTEPYMRDGIMLSRYCDDLIGCAALIEAVKHAEPGKNDMYYVFTVQEEVGCRGAKVAAARVRPDVSVTLEVVPSGDILAPGTDAPRICVGKGPVLRAWDKLTIFDAEVNAAILKTAEEEDISCQVRFSAGGSNNSAAIQQTGLGCRAACLSVPVRNVHSPSEIISLEDAKQMQRIVEKLPSAELPYGAYKL